MKNLLSVLFDKIINYSKNKIKNSGENKIMTHDEEKNNLENCKLHVMPPSITDADINALFNGIINVVRKKIELDARAEIVNMNLNLNKIQKELKEKTAECNRLKNEIIFLKSQINDKN